MPEECFLQPLPLAPVLLAAVLAAVLAAPMPMARAGEMPDLRGVWNTVYATPTETGRLVRESSYEISRQEGELLWGVDAWHPFDPEAGKALAEWIRNPFFGSLGMGGHRGLLAARGVRFAFRIAGPDEMEIEMASFRKLGGLPPTAFYAVLKRGAVGAVSRTRWPDLSGSWRGRCRTVYPDGARPESIHLELVRQDGELLWMDDIWSPTGPVTAATDPDSILRDRLLGSLNPAGTGGVLAKEGVRVGFSLPAPDRMEVEFIRIGGRQEPAMVFYAVLRRGGEEPMAPAAKGFNLVGDWSAGYRYALPDRTVEASSNLVITRQEGNALWAEDVWIRPGGKGSDPVRHRDAMRGGLSPDRTVGGLAKPGACFRFRVLDADHLEFDFTGIGADGDPTAFLGVFTRKH